MTPRRRDRSSPRPTQVHGKVTWELGLPEEALAAYRRSLSLVEQMADASPDDPGVKTALGKAHTRMGFSFRKMGRPAEALQSYEQARTIQEALARDHPAAARYREVLSWTYSNLGVIHLELDHPVDAIHFHRRAIAIHEELVADDPGNPHHRSDLAWAWHHVPGQGRLGRSRDGPATGRAGRGGFERLVRGDLTDPETRWRLARCLDELGRIRVAIGRPAEAAEPLERAAELFLALDRDDPVLYGVDVIRNQLYLASSGNSRVGRGGRGVHLQGRSVPPSALEDLPRTAALRHGMRLWPLERGRPGRGHRACEREPRPPGDRGLRRAALSRPCRRSTSSVAIRSSPPCAPAPTSRN